MSRLVMVRLPRPLPLGPQLSPPSVLFTTLPELSAYSVAGFWGSTTRDASARLARPAPLRRDQLAAPFVLWNTPLPFRPGWNGLATGKLVEPVVPVTKALPAASTAMPVPRSSLPPPR